jgi:hypothetical protein
MARVSDAPRCTIWVKKNKYPRENRHHTWVNGLFSRRNAPNIYREWSRRSNRSIVRESTLWCPWPSPSPRRRARAWSIKGSGETVSNSLALELGALQIARYGQAASIARRAIISGDISKSRSPHSKNTSGIIDMSNICNMLTPPPIRRCERKVAPLPTRYSLVQDNPLWRQTID